MYTFRTSIAQAVARLTCCAALLCIVVSSAAQERKLQNKPFIDERKFHYGFFVGIHDQGLKLENNGHIDEATGRQWMAENDSQNFGFSVGILGDWRLTKWMSLRVSPSLHFGSSHIKFRDLATGDTETQNLKSCYIGIPVGLKFAAQRFNNFRPYVTCGLQPMYNLIGSKHAKLRTKPISVNLEAGLGCDIYLPYFKFIPELKFSLGLSNILQKNRNDLTDASQLIYTESVIKATHNMVTLSFYFE